MATPLEKDTVELEKPCPVLGEEELNMLETHMRVMDISTHRMLGFGNAVCGTGVEEHSLQSRRGEKCVTAVPEIPIILSAWKIFPTVALKYKVHSCK